jgi:hypothetical protein
MIGKPVRDKGQDAELTDANFGPEGRDHATLRDANLNGVKLRNVWLRDADLTGAYLLAADLTGAGVATTKFGLHPTALVYSASLAALVVAAAGILLFGPSGKPARPAPASRAVMPPGPCTGPPCLRATDPPDGSPATIAKSSG